MSSEDYYNARILENNRTALINAVSRGNVEEVERLLSLGTNPNLLDEYLNSLLSSAILNKKYKMAKILLEYGADPNYVYLNRDPSLVYAIHTMEPNLEIIDLLLKHGANPFSKYRNSTIYDSVELLNPYKYQTIIDLIDFYYPITKSAR